MKRIFDFIASLIAVILLSPILISLGGLVWLKLGWPIIFVQKRPGRNGIPFKMMKFRSMTNERDSLGNLLPNEKRITPFGKMLRSFSLDELPELLNVIAGEMSLVGPRPLRMEYLSRYTSHQNRRHEVKPGITGLAQISGRNNLSWEERFNLDVWYVDNHTFWLDIKIIFKTIIKVFKKEGVTPGEKEFMSEFMGYNQKNE